jgi:hypothetical protein
MDDVGCMDGWMEEEAHRKAMGGMDEEMRLVERKIPLYICSTNSWLKRSPTGSQKHFAKHTKKWIASSPIFRPSKIVTASL